LEGPKPTKDPNALLMFIKKEYSAVANTPTNIQKSGQTANGDLGHTVWHLVITFLLIRVIT